MARANASPLSSGRLAAAPRSAAIVFGAIVVLLVISRPAVQVRAAQQDARDTPPGQLLGEGKRLFDAKGCGRCHSIRSSKGEQRVGPDLGRDGSWYDMMQFAGGLWNHTPTTIEKLHGQPIEQPTLSPDETGKLAAYLFYARFLDEPGDMQRGRDLFERRLCIRCHQLRGHGGTVGPRLDELSAYASSFFLAQTLWNHGPEMAAKMEELRLVRPRLEGDDVAQIVAFMRGEAGAAAPMELAYAEAGSPRSGETVFRDKGCIKCHAIGGKGGAVGPDLGKRRPAQHVSELAGALWNHGPPMWTKMKDFGMPVPRLTDREMADLIAYLHFVEYMGDGGDATRGSDLFRQKSCSQCHAVGGEGSKVGPDLAASGALRSSLSWTSGVWNHGPAMQKKFRETQPVWPRFEGDEMRDLVEFLRSYGGGK